MSMLRPSDAVKTSSLSLSRVATTPVSPLTALIASTSEPEASFASTVNPEIFSSLMVMKLVSSRVIWLIAVPSSVVAPTIARTPVVAERSLIAAAFAIAEVLLEFVET
jgi:hypothetical protein